MSGYRSVLGSTVHLCKGYDYQFLWPWLGQGLLTSGGDKWRARRKLLTPAFHGNILRQFLESMTSHAEKLSSKLDSLEESRQECDLSQGGGGGCLEMSEVISGVVVFSVLPLFSGHHL